FNEVFFDNVRVPAENMVANLNEGWSVAITTLAYERDLLTFIRHISLRNALHRLVKLAQSRGRGADPVIRQKIAELWIGEQALALNGYRSLTRILRGGQPGPEGSTSKLFWSRLDQELAQVATEVIGPYSQVAHGSPWAPDEGQWEFYELLARASGIRAGTSAILARGPSRLLGGRPLMHGVRRHLPGADGRGGDDRELRPPHVGARLPLGADAGGLRTARRGIRAELGRPGGPGRPGAHRGPRP